MERNGKVVKRFYNSEVDDLIKRCRRHYWYELNQDPMPWIKAAHEAADVIEEWRMIWIILM